MGGTAPTLFWFDRADERIGILHPAGAVEHREELDGEDVLSFPCLETPEKYDRILWRDPSDGRWREHVVVRIDEVLDAPCEVYAESSLCDLLGSYVEEERVSDLGLYGALSAVLEGTRWQASVLGWFDVHDCYLYHVNRLAALRRACEVWGCEVEPAIAVSGGHVSSRTVRAVAALGSWRGARLEYGRNMTGCTRTVAEDEVFTALYGYGAGLPVVDETGAFTGGYRRKLTFGEVNDGVDWVGNDSARLLWGLPDGSGGRVHRFGEVTFADVEDPEVLLARTQAALAETCAPRVSYEVDAAVLSGSVPVGLGDEVAVVDSSRDPAWRLRARAVRRVRLFGDAL
ncbi:MAG TPA: phage tail protein, partial [Candidatus Olsenella avistercoris]|nr:phage tail protein [Candidatus Olsenella avistercoris]